MSDQTTSPSVSVLWLRRDLRLADNPALQAALKTGRPLVPLFILDEDPAIRAPGAAGLWWLDRSLRALDASLHERGSRLILRRGDARRVLPAFAREVEAKGVYWNRLYDPGQLERDDALKADLEAIGAEGQVFKADLLLEPWDLKTKTGGYYQVFSPFWRAAREAVRPAPAHAPPAALPAPKTWPRSDDIKAWRLHPTKPDWSGGFDVWTPGEAGAQAALQTFIHAPLQEYDEGRDRPDMDGTSGLSPHLHWGEIGPDKVWRAVQARRGGGAASETVADKFLSELGWREFNHHLLHHRPDLPDRNFKPAFDAFPWRQSQPDLKAWREGRTGYPMVDAGMRQLWTSGWMHNRVRMITASFLIKHLLLDWREGERWFWDTLVDASPANNVLNWQWVAGSGADASPFFRIFNPMAQGEKFDPTGRYVRRWAPELAHLTGKDVHAPWTAPPAALSSAGVRLGVTYPRPMVDHDQARRRALEAYQSLPRSGSNAA